MEKREEQLEEYSRQKRRYEKKDTAYWLDGGKSAVASKVANEMEDACSNLQSYYIWAANISSLKLNNRLRVSK